MQKFILQLILLLLLGFGTAMGQNITVKGKVVDERNEELPGATVRVKKTPTVGTVADVNGDFTLQVKEGEVIIVSYMGYQSAEQPAKVSMRVQLMPDNTTLNDVVVVGYMSRKVANTSASIIKVNGEELTKKPIANPLDAVQGKVAGLQVFSSSGEPSSQVSIALHGQGSLGAGTSPLIIMDGMPVSMAMVRAMNPNDIESVQFLKDAAATSIYGARAANGVMYITTKRGQGDSRASIKVNAQYAVSSLANSDYFEQLMTAPELLKYYEETGLYSKSDIEQLKEKYFKGTDFQWYNYVYQPAPMYTGDISISGGSSKLNYYISGGALSQEGLRMGSRYDKAFGRINLNATLNPIIRLGLNVSTSYDKTKVSPFGQNNRTGGGLAAMNSPFISPYDPETGKELDYVQMLDITTPKHVISTNPSNTSSFLLATNGHLTITPIKNLVFRTQLGLETSYATTETRRLPSYIRAYGVGTSSRGFGSVTNFSTTNTLSYTMGFGNHHVTALVGQEYTNYSEDGFNAAGSGLLDDRLYLLSSTTKDYSVAESNTSYNFLSFFTQVSYDYQEKYFVDLVLRNDASSRFGKNHRNGLFWSAGMLWKAKKENFLKDVAWIDVLDLKMSYGTQGNSAIPPYATASYAGKVGQKKGEMSLGYISYGNPDLTWEHQSKFTIGAKVRMLNALEVNVEWYNRVTSNMLFEVPLSYSSGLPQGSLGFVTRYDNVGKYANRGIDVLVRGDVLRHKDYGITLYANMNYNKDEVLELFEGRQNWFEPGTQMAYIVGKPITFVAPLYKGVNTETGVPEWYIPGKDKTMTYRNDKELANEYSSSLEQNTGIPVYTPFTGGWGIEAHWKGFYLNADFFVALGKHMLSVDKQRFENDYYIRDKENNLNGSRRLFDYWKKPGDNAEFPSLEWVRQGYHQSTYIDSKLLENASFMRLKSLTIGYNLPASTLQKLGVLTSARVYFTGRNLFTFTKFRGIDPEVNQNVSIGANPNTKQVSFGIEVGF